MTVKKAGKAYDIIVEDWRAFRSKTGLNPSVEAFISLIQPQGRVLDVGCGTGYPIAAYLDEQGFDVTGIDPSIKMIEEANTLKLKNSRFLLSDLFSFQTQDKYDAIIAFDSLWHIPLDQQPLIYKHLSSLLKPGGVVLFTSGKTHGEIVNPMFEESFYYASLDGAHIQSLLKEAGFSAIQWKEHLVEEHTGSRDLLVVAQKN